jgi:ABC-type dipeptide/oligopeptide/nickel transport system ATPase component
MPAISFQAVSKSYAARRSGGSLLAVDRVSLDIEQGEFFGLLGPNGAGKTTLISMLAGLSQPTSGQVGVLGHDVQKDFAAARRLVGMVHCAETMDQAYRDVEYGMEHWFDYFQTVAAFPQMAVPGNNVKEMIAFVNESGFGAIGTPDMVNAQIDRLWKQSDGGFGAYLMLAHNWANFDATRKSYDLIARHVFPRWQGQMSTQHAADSARASRPELAAIHSAAVEAATQRFAAETAARVH